MHLRDLVEAHREFSHRDVNRELNRFESLLSIAESGALTPSQVDRKSRNRRRNAEAAVR